MEKLGVVLFRAVLLLAGLSAALAREETRYFAVGEKLSLNPPFTGSINSVLWKHDGDLVAEWVKDKLDKTYGRFENRTKMDKATGALEILDIAAADAGLYTVDINKNVQDLSYRVNVIKMVPQPSVELQPLTCSNTDRCDLRCDGETEGAGTVEYFWKTGDGEWKKKEMTVPITKADNRREKTFTCKMKNMVSEKESEAKDNPFYTEEVEKSTGNGGGIAGGVIGSLIFIGITIGLLAYWKRDVIQGWFGGNGTDNNAAGGVAGTGEGVNLTGTGTNAKEDGAPATGNGANSPSVDSSDETSRLPADAVP